MGNVRETLKSALTLEGALGVALGDWKTGMCLGYAGTDNSAFPVANLELAVAGNTQVIRAKLRVAQALKLDAGIEDILITLTNQYHLIRMTQAIEGLFFYLALDREKGNLALARYKLVQLEKSLVI
ncbi:hypothetical protein V2H45_21435 [Tumidithrix elongata RA019]|uniref:Roadblock/LAMTOR2 domain-containing protein n=1 Tax=Tumidithrix elongata BACA0141 TaxID=2716417 RepID=A0AAW9Q7V8_9CYAN|nr:hypothetical protein [Tumidithrix elongata RA019]